MLTTLQIFLISGLSSDNEENKHMKTYDTEKRL